MAAALAHGFEDRRLRVSVALFRREGVELAGFGGLEEAGLDDVGVGHAAPAPLDEVAAFFGDLPGPHRFEIARAEPFGDGGDGRGLARLADVGIERAGQGQRLDHRRIVILGRITHQGADAAGMFDQFAKRLAGALFGAFQQQAVEPGIDQILVERGIVLEIDFGPAAGDFVERRLGDVEVPALDQFGHLAVEEGQQQGADMRAVDVGVGHDHDLVIAQFLEVEFLAPDRGAERLDHGADFLRPQHPVEARALDVEDLALQGQDRLDVAVAALLGRAAGAVALDQEQFALGRDRVPGNRPACRAMRRCPSRPCGGSVRALSWRPRARRRRRSSSG